MSDFIWLQRDIVLALYTEQIAEHGGTEGPRDEGLLDGALARPQNLFAYSAISIFDLAAAYGFGIAQNHPFVDGNKRTCFLAAATFLYLNGYEVETTQIDVVETILDLAGGKIAEADFARWLEAVCVPIS
ncbi:MAG: type II toxin-antitoxin system death-on-curing family toxin [Pseudomonadota bacterium]